MPRSPPQKPLYSRTFNSYNPQASAVFQASPCNKKMRLQTEKTGKGRGQPGEQTQEKNGNVPDHSTTTRERRREIHSTPLFVVGKKKSVIATEGEGLNQETNGNDSIAPVNFEGGGSCSGPPLVIMLERGGRCRGGRDWGNGKKGRAARRNENGQPGNKQR